MSALLEIPVPPKGAPADAGNRPIAYRREEQNGGKNPDAPHCADWSYGNRTPTADCIGFALWASGIDRLQPGYDGTRGEWLNCHSLLADAGSDQRFCRPLRMGEAAAPGDWLLTKSHIGVIVRPETRASKVLIVDCSPRHGRDTAVGLGGPWSASCVVVRPLHYADV
jgi:hypothetical protein